VVEFGRLGILEGRRDALKECPMLTFVFLGFIALFAIAAILISISAKKRKQGGRERQLHPRSNSPTMGRANSDED
jgi:hypothetical protein